MQRTMLNQILATDHDVATLLTTPNPAAMVPVA
jgi:hypothetical protein